MRLELRFHIEVNFACFPFGSCLDEEGGDEPEDGGFIGKEAGDAGPAFEFEIDAFESVGGAKFEVVCGGEGKDVEAFREILLEPGG